MCVNTGLISGLVTATYLSAVSLMCLGSSPTGTASGASCSLMTCSSTKLHFSWTITYGSSGHSFGSPGMVSPAHRRGRVKPEKPPETVRCATCRQLLHMMFSCDARDVSTDAEMTMPGRRTSLLMYEAWKKRTRRERRVSSVPMQLCSSSAAAHMQVAELERPRPTPQDHLHVCSVPLCYPLLARLRHRRAGIAVLLARGWVVLGECIVSIR